MRRPLAFALVVASVALASCAPAPRGPAAPIAQEQVVAAPELTSSSSRQTVRELIEAYAGSPRDGGAALAELVTGDELERWVYWLGIQHAQFPGRVDGEADIRRIAFVGTAPVNQALGAQVQLSASVDFTYAPLGEDPFERARILDGPVTLVSRRPGDWRVLDLTRDGVPMSDGIELFTDEVLEDDGVAVRLDSLFMFTPNWQFNVIVENRTTEAIALDPEATGLYIEGPGGDFERVGGVPSPALGQVPGGTGVQTLLAFPLQDSADDRVLVLTFRSEEQVYGFDFPLEDLVRAVPPPPPTTGSDGGRTTG